MRQRINTAALAVGTLAVIWASLAPPPSVATAGPDGTAYLGHLVAYFAIAAGFLVVFHDTTRGHRHAITAAVGLGLVLELLQLPLPYRHFGWPDLMANTAGAALVLLDHDSRLITRLIALEDRIISRIVDETLRERL